MKNIINLFGDLNWRKATDYPDGTLIKNLKDDDNGKTILLKLPKGFSMPLHSHLTTEQHLVLDGKYTTDNVIYSKGSYQIFRAHEDHGPF